MKLKELSKYEALIGALIGASSGVSVSSGNLFWMVMTVLVCLPVYYKLRKSVDEVVEDEMIFRLSEKASRTAFRLFTPVAAFAGLVIVVLRDIYPQYSQIGFTLAYSACGLILIYVAAIKYHMKKGV